MFHFFTVPLKNPEKAIWCNKMGKVVTKVWKPSVMFTQFIIISNGIKTKYGLSHFILRSFKFIFSFFEFSFQPYVFAPNCRCGSLHYQQRVSKSDLDKINPKQLSITGKTRKKNLSKTKQALKGSVWAKMR